MGTYSKIAANIALVPFLAVVACGGSSGSGGDTVQTQKVEIVSDDGEVVITLESNDDSYGIFVNDGFGEMVPLKQGQLFSKDDVAMAEKMVNEAKALKERDEVKAEDIRVQHILISFEGAPRAKATRTLVEAKMLASQLYRTIKSEPNVDFPSLMNNHSDDTGPGDYTMTTSGTPKPGVTPRGGMVPAFGDVGYKLKVGEIGVALHDERNSPYGYHIIKRVE